MQKLVRSLAPTMLSIDKGFDVRAKVDSTISRIYRDTRFSKDKSPFRSNMWITFKRPDPAWTDRPGFFFELMPDCYRFGMGYYSASPTTMKCFRKAVTLAPETFIKTIEPIGDYFTVEGEDYKRPFPGDRPNMINKYYNKKSFYLMHGCEPDELIFSSALVSEIIGGLQKLKPLYLFLSNLINKEE
jgi:uncharacterized protein (TIGR02453 family)